jgi:hypothetical protein
MHEVLNFLPYFPKIHSNNILISARNSSKWSPPFRFSDQNFEPVSHHYLALYIPAHHILFDLIILMICSEA